ncbi:MAG: restriction endonuclease [bacterium]|nr:restriction endonuclease [bacterium]
MFDVFTEEIEVTIKDGMANLYWYKGDLHKSWLRSGVDIALCNQIKNTKNAEANNLTKRQQMDLLYQTLRDNDYNRRLEISRNFVRILIEQKTFSPQDPKHRIEIAEKAALKLKDIIREQEKDLEYQESIKRKAHKSKEKDYYTQLLEIRDDFVSAQELEPQQKGYALEKLFVKLMQASQVLVEEPFCIKGEQLDGAIKHDGHYYLIELKWTQSKVEPKDIGSFFYKVEGKLDSRGLIISMNGYTDGVIDSLPRGKELKILLMDGIHLANVIYGMYTFRELLEHAISQASLKANLYCNHNLKA